LATVVLDEEQMIMGKAWSFGRVIAERKEEEKRHAQCLEKVMLIDSNAA